MISIIFQWVELHSMGSVGANMGERQEASEGCCYSSEIWFLICCQLTISHCVTILSDRKT